MATQKIRGLHKALFGHAGLAVFTVAFVLVPLGLTVYGAAHSTSRPGGFGQENGTLALLALISAATSVGAAIISLLVAVISSSYGLYNGWFHRFYRVWLVSMLFTNPVFIVLGLSTLMASTNALLAVVLATAYVVLPLGGLIIQSAFDQFPRNQLLAASALGANRITVISKHVLPGARGQIDLALLLMSIYSLGFYLLPTFVGLGQVVTLGTAINTQANRVGDWPAAQQLACVTLGLQAVILLVWHFFLRSHRRPT